MDLLFFLLIFSIGLVLFISAAYFLAKWLFPRIREDEPAYTAKRSSQARVSKKNPYSF